MRNAFLALGLVTFLSVAGFGCATASLADQWTAMLWGGGRAGEKDVDAVKEVVPTVVRPMEVQPLFGKGKKTIFDPEYSAHVPVILHMWGTWCGPCRGEFYSLLEFSEKNPDVRICAVAWLDNLESVTRFLKFTPYDPRKHTGIYLVVNDGDLGSPDAKYYDVGTFPTTMFVDPRGNILQRVEGTINWNDKNVRKQVKLFLEGKPFKVQAE